MKYIFKKKKCSSVLSSINFRLSPLFLVLINQLHVGAKYWKLELQVFICSVLSQCRKSFYWAYHKTFARNWSCVIFKNSFVHYLTNTVSAVPRSCRDWLSLSSKLTCSTSFSKINANKCLVIYGRVSFCFGCCIFGILE